MPRRKEGFCTDGPNCSKKNPGRRYLDLTPVVFLLKTAKDTPEISFVNAGLQTMEVSVLSSPSALNKHSDETEEA